MCFDQEDERKSFEIFGEAANDDAREPMAAAFEPADVEPTAPWKVKMAFSWAGFAGGLAALAWVAGAIGLQLSYYGVDAALTMGAAMQAGMIAFAFGPALLFWVTASAAGEALKARRLAVELTRLAQAARLPVESGAAFSSMVKSEIDALNDAMAAALDRMADLESAAQRNAALFDDAVAASRDTANAMSQALQHEREALVELNRALRGQTETMAHSIGRQIRLMREASKMVSTEVCAAEDALETHLASFTASASVMGERTAAFHQAADSAAAATASLNGTMTSMLDGLSEATRLADAARKSGEQAVLAANETASAVRETTRSAVYEAKRATQLIRAEAAALQNAASSTPVKLSDAAQAARAASQESQAAADHHATAIEKRLGALAATGAKRPVVRATERPVERRFAGGPQVTALQAAANAAVERPRSQPRQESERRVFKGFSARDNFVPSRFQDTPVPANDGLVDFSKVDPDAALKRDVLRAVANAGVDLDGALLPEDLDRIARSSRQGSAARRGAVLDVAPGAVGRIARHVKRHGDARDVASRFRARPDLAKSEDKGECSDLVRAYLLIDAALD